MAITQVPGQRLCLVEEDGSVERPRLKNREEGMRLTREVGPQDMVVEFTVLIF